MNTKILWSVVLSMVFLLAFTFIGYAGESAHYKLPSSNASIVVPAEMPKFLEPKLLTNRHGIKRGITEGFIIRQSSIRDGKIVIPPAGLIYFTFGGEYFSNLNGEPFVVAGKEAIWVEKQEAVLVKQNFTVPLNKPPLPLGEEGTIAIAHTYFNDRYMGVRRADFKYVFANGYTTWGLSTLISSGGYARSRSAVAYGNLQGEGMIIPPPYQFYGDPFDASSSYYIAVDSVTPQGIKVSEAGAAEIVWFKISYEKPIIADDVTEGQILPVGKYRAKVSSIDSKLGTVGIALLDSGGNTIAEKTLGPLTLKTYEVKNRIEHDMATRLSMALDYENIRIQLNTKFDPVWGPGPTKLMNEAGDFIPLPQVDEVSTFHGGKVDLVMYEDIQKMELRKPWKEDSRFVFQTAYI
ncbi:MAG: hypothetical protein JW932_00185 [Deltaproteobacteria bacterium]|nr:hypothetical protein [Deltaproteobacteria bacterium]